MRETWFAAKRQDNGHWVRGHCDYRPIPGEFVIHVTGYTPPTRLDPCGGVYSAYHIVNPETICQFTGLHDKDGREIYEGDVITMIDHWYEGDAHMIGFIGKVIFQDGGFVVDDNKEFRQMSLDKATIDNYGFTVIGNVHEDKELL